MRLLPNQTGKVTADALNVRSGAGTSYRIIGTVYYGNKVTITERRMIPRVLSGTGSHILQVPGYVSAAYITITSSSSSSDTGTTDASFEDI